MARVDRFARVRLPRGPEKEAALGPVRESLVDRDVRDEHDPHFVGPATRRQSLERFVEVTC